MTTPPLPQGLSLGSAPTLPPPPGPWALGRGPWTHHPWGLALAQGPGPRAQGPGGEDEWGGEGEGGGPQERSLGKVKATPPLLQKSNFLYSTFWGRSITTSVVLLN